MSTRKIDFITHSILGVPMHNADQETIGVLEAINKQGRENLLVRTWKPWSPWRISPAWL
jgi:GAF domain-containing protein